MRASVCVKLFKRIYALNKCDTVKSIQVNLWINVMLFVAININSYDNFKWNSIILKSI